MNMLEAINFDSQLSACIKHIFFIEILDYLLPYPLHFTRKSKNQVFFLVLWTTLESSWFFSWNFRILKKVKNPPKRQMRDTKGEDGKRQHRRRVALISSGVFRQLSRCKPETGSSFLLFQIRPF